MHTYTYTYTYPGASTYSILPSLVSLASQLPPLLRPMPPQMTSPSNANGIPTDSSAPSASSASASSSSTSSSPSINGFTFDSRGVKEDRSSGSGSGSGSEVKSKNETSPSTSYGPSFFAFMQSELFVNDDTAASACSDTSSLPSQLVYNFLILPWYLERLFTLGFMICLDCFLHLFTVLPFRMGVAFINLMRALICPFRRRGGGGASSSSSSSSGGDGRIRLGLRLNGAQLCDLCRGLLLITCWYGLAFINMSRLYHYIRGQSVLKLYVIFNMLQISDRLFCSFGEDILESLFASIQALAAPPSSSPSTSHSHSKGGKGVQCAPTSKSVQLLHVIFHFAISVVYVCQ